MLKKAGIVVATAAAGLLAVSPLAFAGDMGYGHDHGHDHGHKGDKGASYSKHYESNNETNYDHSPSCNAAPQTVGNNLPQNATGVASPLVGILGIAANVAAPVTTQLQAPILSCNNLQDIANVNVSDNFQDNSQTRTSTNRSFNG
ncbi:MAG: hypothetical protein QOH17_576 [Pseudonocardiales bacterium]|nr:hypothetical protein [Pseudonocardiales bacterium]